MIILPATDYFKVEELIKKIHFNVHFAKTVIEGKISGRVYANEIENPNTFYILHPYGMSLLLGNNSDCAFNKAFKSYVLNKNRNKAEFMQVYPAQWNDTLHQMFDISSEAAPSEYAEVNLHTRVNFKFNEERYSALNIKNHNASFVIKRTDAKAFVDMKGSVVPAFFWENVEDFLEEGVGFSLFYNGELAATAYSAFIHDKQLEIGIETVEGFRGKGLAKLVCAALIDYCLVNDFEPVWACRLGNAGSYNLALSLGFQVQKELSYYELKC